MTFRPNRLRLLNGNNPQVVFVDMSSGCIELLS